MKTVRSLLMGFFLTLIVGGVAYSLLAAARAVCCEIDLDALRAQLTTSAGLNISISALLTRLKFKAAGWRWILASFTLAAIASALWTVAYWLARTAGLSSAESTLVGYLTSAARSEARRWSNGKTRGMTSAPRRSVVAGANGSTRGTGCRPPRPE